VSRDEERLMPIITHRCSAAKRDGCFQRSLFVCQCACLFVRKVTFERLNIGRSNLAIRYNVQKSRPSSKVKVKGQRSRSLGTKKRKTADSSQLTMHSRACAVARPYAARRNRRYHCMPTGHDGLRRWENQRMLSSLFMIYGHDLNASKILRRSIQAVLDGPR